jgi:hypothetical protein
VTKKNAVFVDVTLCVSGTNRHFGETHRLHHQDEKNPRGTNNVGRGSVLHLPATANVSSTLVIFTLMMDAIRSSETSVFPRATRCHIPEDGIVLNLIIF